MHSTLLLIYLKWHFFDAAGELFRALRNILWFNYNYFSIGLLIRTYFAPWRKVTWDYGRGFEIGRFLFIFFSNVISRILGAIMRSFLIITGSIIQTVLFIAAILIFFVWIFLPLLIVISFIYGIYLLF